MKPGTILHIKAGILCDRGYLERDAVRQLSETPPHALRQYVQSAWVEYVKESNRQAVELLAEIESVKEKEKAEMQRIIYDTVFMAVKAGNTDLLNELKDVVAFFDAKDAANAAYKKATQ